MDSQIRANSRRYAALVGLLAAEAWVVAALVALLLGLGWLGIGLALVVAVAAAAAAVGAGERVVLRLTGARPADPEQYPRYHNLVEGLCEAVGLPMPALYVVDSQAPNALALARSQARTAVVVTTGLVGKLNRVELEGVLAHELSHLRSRAARVSTAVVVTGGLPGLLWASRRRSRSGAGRALLGAAAVVALPLAPLLRLGATRAMELEADESGAYLTRYPPGLASALSKIAVDTSGPPPGADNPGLRHLWTVPPDDLPASGFPRLPETHPPLAERLTALRDL